MKKTLAILSALLLVAALSACGKDDEVETTIAPTEPVATVQNTVSVHETPETDPVSAAVQTTAPIIDNETVLISYVDEPTGTDFRNNPISYTPDKKDKAFFDDAVFVGDSVTLGLKNYTTSQRNKGNYCLGEAAFLCCGNLSYANAVQPVSASSVHPAYKGQKMTIEDGIRACGAKKVFIMLGMNDFAAYTREEYKRNIHTLFDRIAEKNPDADLYIESITPMIAEKERKRFCNENMRIFNEDMQEICEEKGYPYIDISGQVMVDENGCLKHAYCGDIPALGLHMSNEGSAAWAGYLTDTFCGSIE